MPNITARFFRDHDRNADMVEIANAADNNSNVRKATDDDKSTYSKEWDDYKKERADDREQRRRDMDPSLPELEKEREEKSERDEDDRDDPPVGTYESQPTGTTTEGPAGQARESDGLKTVDGRGGTFHEGNKGPHQKKKGGK